MNAQEALVLSKKSMLRAKERQLSALLEDIKDAALLGQQVIFKNTADICAENVRYLTAQGYKVSEPDNCSVRKIDWSE